MAQSLLGSIRMFSHPFYFRKCFHTISSRLIRHTAARAYTCASMIKPCERVLIAGGTGIVGYGIVQAMLKQGTKVVVVSRCLEHYNTLCDATPESLRCNLSVVMGDLRTEDGMQSVFEQVMDNCAGLQHVVASLKGTSTWWPCGRIWDQGSPALYGSCVTEVLPHFLMMRAFLPHLENVVGSTYTLITGYPANTTKCSMTGKQSSLVCLAAGAVHGLADGARGEHLHGYVAVNEIHLKCTVHKRLDREVCNLGNQDVGSDLIGSVVVGAAGCGARKELIIRTREDAMPWADMDPHGGPFPCPSSCLAPCLPCPPHPCPTDPCR